MKRKHSFLVFFVFFLVIGVCGCMKGQSKTDRMLAYINSKYPEDTFTFDHVTGGHIGSNVTTAIVRSEKYPDSAIRVFCTVVEKTESFSDTYLSVKYENQTREYLRGIFESLYGPDCYVSYKPSDIGVTKNESAKTSFEAYLAEPSSGIQFQAIVKYFPEDKDETLSQVKAALSDITASGYILYIRDPSVVLDDSTAKEIVNKQAYDACLALIKSDTETYYTAEWR